MLFRIRIVVSVVLITVLLTGCGAGTADLKNAARPEDVVIRPEADEKPVYNEIGNTSGNISNYGLVARQGKWIYYSPPYSYTSERNEGLYKVKQDGTVRIKLSDDSASYINVVGEWIYYACPNDHYRLKKVKTDGTENISLSQDRLKWLFVKGDLMYYTDGSEIYRCKTDGTEKTVLLKALDYQLDFFELYGDYAFVRIRRGNANTQELDVINLKTLGSRKLHEGTYTMVETDGEWLYFIDEAKECNLYKIKLNGTGLTRLTEQAVSCFNLGEACIYYVSDSSVYRIDKNGKNKTDLQTLLLNSYLLYFDKRIYYFSITGLETRTVE